MAKYTEEQKQKALLLLGTRRKKQFIRQVAREVGVPYSTLFNWVHPPVPREEKLWTELCRRASQDGMIALKQNKRIFLLKKQEYDDAHEYGQEYDDEEEYDLETTTSFPDTADGLEGALSWLDPSYSDQEEEEE